MTVTRAEIAARTRHYHHLINVREQRNMIPAVLISLDLQIVATHCQGKVAAGEPRLAALD